MSPVFSACVRTTTRRSTILTDIAHHVARPGVRAARGVAIHRARRHWGPEPGEVRLVTLRYVTENYLLGNRPSMALRCVRAREWW